MPRILPIIVLLLTACGNGTDRSRAQNAEPSSATIQTISPDSTGPAAAQAVIRTYYDAIDRGDYHRAYLLWADSGRASNQSFEDFRAGFTATASVEVTVGVPSRIEGAAGSRYIEIPVEIEAVTKSGRPQRFAGSYTLRHAVVDGATERQATWHIHGADIVPCPDECRRSAVDSSRSSVPAS